MYSNMQKIKEHIKGYWVLITLIIFIFFLVSVLPGQSSQSLDLGMMESPDTSFYYTGEELYAIAGDYTQEARDFYVRQRFTFDIIWPAVYGIFMFITSLFLMLRNDFDKKYYRLLYIPVAGVVFDLFENIACALVMYRYPVLTDFFANIAGVMTALKWTTLTIAFVQIVIWTVKYLMMKLRVKTKKIHP
jgi:hypothetical protein